MKYFSFLLTLSLLFMSCSNGRLEYREGCKDYSFNGWIEDAGAKGVYLVNTSKSKKITFTIKESNFSQWNPNGTSSIYKVYKTGNEIETKTYTLNPGEEQYLTCSDIVQSSDSKIISKYKYEITGELIESK